MSNFQNWTVKQVAEYINHADAKERTTVKYQLAAGKLANLILFDLPRIIEDMKKENGLECQVERTDS